MQLSALLPVIGLLAAISGAEANNHRGGVARRGHHMPRSVNDNTLAALAAKRGLNRRAKRCRVRPAGQGSAATGAAPNPTPSAAVPAVPGASSAVPSVDAGNSAAPSAAPSAPAASPSAAAPSSDAAPPATSSSAPPPSGGGLTASTIPNGKKAGISSGNGLSQFAPHLSWWYDWNAAPSSNDAPGLIYVPMLWGSGNLGGEQNDAARVDSFRSVGDPTYIMGFEEPDCSTPGSANMDIQTTIDKWNELIAPKSNSLLISPSWCKQIHEEYMKPFTAGISRPYDITNVHINKNNMDGVRAAIDHYAQYNKPLWITEFACVDDSTGFTPCTDEGQITQFIYDIVDLFENDSRVHAYAFSNGLGLGDAWRLTEGDGNTLTAAGRAYLNAISKYH